MASLLLEKSFLEWLGEDAPLGDVTSETIIPEDLTVRAVVKAGEEGIAACVEEASLILRSLGLSVRLYKRSGEKVGRGDRIMELEGDARKILLVERTLLNLLSYLFGIATTTHRLVEKARRINPAVRIAATRKIVPGLRYLAKRAVEIGGGDTHRLSLSDAVLVKDNHLAILGSVEEAVKKARGKTSFTHKIEVEVETMEDAVKAAEAGVDIVMADNFNPESLARLIRVLEEKGLRGKVLVEASGGIGPENIEAYVKAGPDIISTSYITMKASPIDLSLDIVEVKEH